MSAEDNYNKPLAYVSAIVLFIMSIAGGYAPKAMAGVSPKWIGMANSIAGGTLVSVAIVHMVGESAEALEPWSDDLYHLLTGEDDHDDHEHGDHEGHDHDDHEGHDHDHDDHDDHDHGENETGHDHDDHEGHDHDDHGGHDHSHGVPLADILLFTGFFVTLIVHECTPHDHEHVHVAKDVERDNDDSSGTEQESDTDNHERVVTIEKNSIVSAVGTVAGIFLHAFVEGLAMGVANTMVLYIAVGMHKFFGAFAVGTALYPVTSNAGFWVGIGAFAFVSVIGIFIGGALTDVMNGPSVGAMQCFAAGTLLCVGITDMLLPGLAGGGAWGKRKVVAALVAALITAIVPIWA